MNPIRLGAIASLGLLFSITCAAVPVGSGQGLQFAQLDLSFGAAPQPNSSYGLAAVDFGQLASSTGVGQGYLNIATSAGWVVQNMVIDPGKDQPGSSTMFNLGSPPGVAVGNLLAYADFSAVPTTSFNYSPATSFVVGKVGFNAQGRNAPVMAPVAPAATPVIGWLAGGATTWIQQAFRESVEQDVNQCGPGSFANSLQWLEDQFRVNVPDDHVPGILGKPAASLVGEIDRKMGRQPHRTVTDDQLMKGKLDYIAENALAEELVVKHWGGGFAPGDQLSTDGSVKSRDESLSGISLVDWIIQEIANGEDVELALGGNVMHWINVTGAGRTLGVPWISWTHDAKQGYDDKGTADTGDDTTLRNGGTNWWDGGVGWSPIVNGRLGSFIAGATPDFAVSESVPEPGTLLLVGPALAALALRLRLRA